MTTTLSPRTDDGTGIRRFAVRRPVTAYLAVVLSLGLPLLSFAAVAGLPQEPFLLVVVFVGLTGAALLITRWADGPGAVRALVGRLLRWRFGVAHWLLVLLAMPLATLAVAAATGTLRAPADGWAREVGVYLFLVFIFGGLLLNLWEELGWTGFLQARLMSRHGLLAGSLLTAVPFALLHLPRPFVVGWTWPAAGIGLVALLAMAPFHRYLLGALYLDTAGSLLAVGLLHASVNACAALGAVDGGWQYIPAVAVVAVGYGLARRRSRPAR